MSAWRRTAISYFPEYRNLIEESENIGMLWVELRSMFVIAHSEPVNLEIIRKIYQFANWTVTKCRDKEIQTSTICHFYEHLGDDPRFVKYLPLYMNNDEFKSFRDVFSYHLSDEELRAFESEYTSNLKEIRGNSR